MVMVFLVKHRDLSHVLFTSLLGCAPYVMVLAHKPLTLNLIDFIFWSLRLYLKIKILQLYLLCPNIHLAQRRISMFLDTFLNYFVAI
ncbi:hypothetical protein EVG64_15550 [Salmonella enterica subsp. enterica serovar Corvallis]|nr:hypothetical protein [Salmonella enterica subsp. enterica serovar Corvallis]ECE8036705.1 hypothetical protein [Salmonella enterica subsp. enterica serovar Corvallis]